MAVNAIVGRGPLRNEFRITVVGAQRLKQMESTVKEIAVRVVCEFGTHTLSDVTQNEVSSDLAGGVLTPVCIDPIRSLCTELGWPLRHPVHVANLVGARRTARCRRHTRCATHLNLYAFGTITDSTRCSMACSDWLFNLGK